MDALQAKTQHWHYNAKTKGLHSELFSRKVLFEGANKNLIVFTYRGMKNQRFEYDEVNKTWKNTET